MLGLRVVLFGVLLAAHADERLRDAIGRLREGWRRRETLQSTIAHIARDGPLS